MDVKQDSFENVGVFKLSPSDVGHLFQWAGLRGNSLATFAYDAETTSTTSPSPFFEQCQEDPRFKTMALNFLEPVLKITFNRGGGSSAPEKFYLLFSNADKETVAQFTNDEGDLLLLLFDNFDAFLEWWTSIYASNSSGSYQPVFPELMETETLVCALHSIDVYHRAYLESMLEYSGELGLTLTTSDFIDLLKRALASGDKRWLLPTLFELTPYLKSSNIALKPENIEQIEELGFLSSSAEGVLTLGERARLMGTEFITSFLGATGFQATVLLDGEEVSLSRVFLATTAFTNHLCSFENAAGGATRFRHQALNASELRTALGKWLEALLKAIDKPVVDKAPIAGNVPRFCGNCGTPLVEGRKFCSNCGNPVKGSDF